MALRTGSTLDAQARDAFTLARLLENERDAVEALRQMSAREYHEAIASHPDRQSLSQTTKDLLCVAGCGLDEAAGIEFVDDEETVSEYGSERTQGEESEQDVRRYVTQGAGNYHIGPYAKSSASGGGGGGEGRVRGSGGSGAGNDRTDLHAEGHVRRTVGGGAGGDGGNTVGNDRRGDNGDDYSDRVEDYAAQGTVNYRADLYVKGRPHGDGGDGGENVANGNVGSDNVGNDSVINDRCGNNGGDSSDDDVEVIAPPQLHPRLSEAPDMACARSTRSRQKDGYGHRGSKGSRANRSTSPGRSGSGVGGRSGAGVGNVYREPISGRTSASKPSGYRTAISVATRKPPTSTVATPAAASAAGTAMMVSRRDIAETPPMEAEAAAAPTPAVSGFAAGGAVAMASATSAAPPIATNNLPYADVIFIDDAKWRDEYLGGVFQPPVRRAAAKAMNKISEISMAASIGPTSPRRKSTGRSGRGRCGTAARGAFDFESSSEEESQRRHSIGGDDSGGGGGGSGDGGSGGVDHAGGIVPQKRPVSPMQGPISIQTRGRDGSGEVNLSFELDPRLFVYMAPGACDKTGCVFVREAHCHRGPACDCVRNRDSYTIPRESTRILEHQNEHIARNANPAVGKRVLVKFSDSVWYKGTIIARKKRSASSSAAAATAAAAAAPISPPGAFGSGGYCDKWQIVFDDTDTRTFYTGDPEVMISNQPLPHNLPPEVKALYRKHENGRALLMTDTKARATALAEINASSGRGVGTTGDALQTSTPSAVPEARTQRCRRR